MAYDTRSQPQWQPQQPPGYPLGLLSLLQGDQPPPEAPTPSPPPSNSYPQGQNAGAEFLRALLQMPQQWA